MSKQSGAGGSVRGVGRRVAVLVLLLWSGAARAQQEEKPELRYLESGKANYSLGKYALAVQDLRLARFMSLDTPARHLEIIARLAVAEDAAGAIAARDASLTRFLEVEALFPEYEAASRAGRAATLSGPRPQALLARPYSCDARACRRARPDSEGHFGPPADRDPACGDEHTRAAVSGNADTCSRAGSRGRKRAVAGTLDANGGAASDRESDGGSRDSHSGAPDRHRDARGDGIADGDRDPAPPPTRTATTAPSPTMTATAVPTATATTTAVPTATATRTAVHGDGHDDGRPHGDGDTFPDENRDGAADGHDDACSHVHGDRHGHSHGASIGHPDADLDEHVDSDTDAPRSNGDS